MPPTLWTVLAPPPCGSRAGCAALSYISGCMPPADSFAAVLFDLDGVLTPTADIHVRAWTTMFDEFLEPRGLAPFTTADYLRVRRRQAAVRRRPVVPRVARDHAARR